MKNSFKYKITSTIAAFALPIAALLSAPATQAYDVKSWSGANCQAYFGNQEGDFGKYAYGIYNSASAHRWLSCGVTRDKLFTNPSNIGTVAFWVYVVVPGNSQTNCYLRENTVNGAAVQTASGVRNGTGWISVDTAASATDGSRTLYCYLPSGGRLSHIRSYEYTLTDTNS